MSDTRFYVAVKPTTLAIETSVGATSITPTVIKDREGNDVSIMATYFGTKGFGVISPGTTKEEQFTFTGISAGVCTGVSHVTMRAPLTETSGLSLTHSAGEPVILMTNSPAFYNEFPNKNNDETINAVWTFDADAIPTYDANPSFTPGSNQLASIKYADDLAIAGSPDSSEGTKGIVEVATQTEVDTKDDSGSTTAPTVVTPSKLRATKYHDYVLDTGTANAYAIAPSPAISAYADGQVFVWRAVNANTDVSTLNVNSLGAKSLRTNVGDILVPGAIEAGSLHVSVYDLTNDYFRNILHIKNPSEVNFTLGESMARGDVAMLSSADTIKRYSPTALPTTFDQTATLSATSGFGTANRVGVLVNLSTSLKSRIGVNTANEVKIERIPITATTGAVGTITRDSGSLSGDKSVDAVKAGTDKVLVCHTNGTTIQATCADLSSTISLGSTATVDNTNADTGYCEYISDSHVLFIYKDTSASSIVFAKYTLSGTTLSSSTTGTVVSLAGQTFALRGVRRLAGTDNILLIIQNSTAGSAQCAVASYVQGSSSFTIGSWVNFPSDDDISSGANDNTVIAPLTATSSVITYQSDTTTKKTRLITVSGTVPTISTSAISTTTGTNAPMVLTALNERAVMLGTQTTTTGKLQLLEVNSTQTVLIERTSQTYSGISLASDTMLAPFPVSPKRFGIVMTEVTTVDTIAKTAEYTFGNFVMGILNATGSNGATGNVIISGYTDDVTGLTAGTKYYADLAGALTATSDGTPPTILIAKDATEGIIRIA